jgi:hypothetical protein
MADLFSLIPDPMPSWLVRAMDSSTPTTDRNETVQTASSYVEDLEGEVLFPTIRMGEEGLYRPEDPLKEALDRGDFILIPGPPGKETAARATDLSKYISNVLISDSRGSFVDKPLYEGGS